MICHQKVQSQRDMIVKNKGQMLSEIKGGCRMIAWNIITSANIINNMTELCDVSLFAFIIDY